MPKKHRRTASRLDLRGALVTASIALIAAAGAHADGSGFFDAAQVASGRFDYSQKCSVCHGAQLQGAGAPALHGPTFATQWNGKALSEFYKYVHDQMPLGQAGTLDGQQYADCYMSIELVGLSGGNAYLNLYQDIAHFTEIYYDGDKVRAAGESADPGGLPHAMAIAFYGSQVYYLYMKAGETTWQPPLAVKGRSSWMDDGADDALGFGDSGVVNDSATFDDFNVNVVTTADLQ